jgi:hypothetical protein
MTPDFADVFALFRRSGKTGGRRERPSSPRAARAVGRGADLAIFPGILTLSLLKTPKAKEILEFLRHLEF